MANDEMKSIERDLEETRSRTERTIEELQAKLNPRAVLDETTRYFRGTDSGEYAEDMTRNAIAQAKENPLPLALIGVGAALLAANVPAAGVTSMKTPMPAPKKAMPAPMRKVSALKTGRTRVATEKRSTLFTTPSGKRRTGSSAPRTRSTRLWFVIRTRPKMPITRGYMPPAPGP